jgi:PhnB protein
MHGATRVGHPTVLVSDGRCAGPTSFEGFSLALSASTTAEAEKLFAAPSEGGQVLQPLITTLFSPRFGIVADRFGMSWKVSFLAALQLPNGTRSGCPAP